METFFVIIFWLLLIDSIGANISAWFGFDKWYQKFTVLVRLFPLTKGWTTFYFILVLYTGFILSYFEVDLLF